MRTRADRLIGLEDVVRMLRKEVERAGSQAEWARQGSVNSPDLSGTVTGKRPPTKDILKALRLKKAFAYQSISGRNRRLLSSKRSSVGFGRKSRLPVVSRYG